MSTNQDSPKADELNTGVPPEAPFRFQFSLLSMFVVTTGVAVTCSLTFTMPDVAAIPLFVLFSMILTGVLITAIIYGRGYQRTFYIGALVPFGVLLFALSFASVIFLLDGPPSRANPSTCRLAVAGFWASSILVGASCVGVRLLIERRHASPPP